LAAKGERVQYHTTTHHDTVFGHLLPLLSARPTDAPRWEKGIFLHRHHHNRFWLQTALLEIAPALSFGKLRGETAFRAFDCPSPQGEKQLVQRFGCSLKNLDAAPFADKRTPARTAAV